VDDSRLVRLGAVAGIVFALLYLGALFGVLDLPEGADSDEAVQDAFGPDNRTGIIVGVYMLAAAGLAFLVFLSALVRRLGAVDESPLRGISGAAGVVFVAMLFGAAACWGVLAFATALDELPGPVDVPLARGLTQLGFVLLLIFGLVSAAALIGAASLLGWRSGALPRWLAILGFVVAPLLLLGPFYVPQLLLLIWVVAASAVLFRSPVGA
jgi:hypothetical protein